MGPPVAADTGQAVGGGEAGLEPGEPGWQSRPGQKGGDGCDWGHKGKGCTAMRVAEASGIPVAVEVYPASTHESQTALAALDAVRIPQPGRKPRKRIRVLAMDKAFDSMPLRRKLRARGVRASVPERRYKHRRRRGPKPKLHPASKRRHQVERLHAWMDNYRVLVVRYERKAHNYRGLMIFAAILICIRVLLNW